MALANQIPDVNIKYMTGFHKIIDMKLAKTLSLISRTKHWKFSNTETELKKSVAYKKYMY